MKHTLPLLLACASACLFASDTSIETPWHRVCKAARGRELTLTTRPGEVIQGHCVVVDADSISVRLADHSIYLIARSKLAKLEVSAGKGGHVKALGRGVHNGLQWGFRNGFSPSAVIGIPAIPITLAWGAVSLPFCGLGDLFAKPQGTREIKVMP